MNWQHEPAASPINIIMLPTPPVWYLSVLNLSLTRQYNFWQTSWNSMIRERGDSSCVCSRKRNAVTLHRHYVCRHDCMQRDTKSEGKPKLQSGEWLMSYEYIIATRLSFQGTGTQPRKKCLLAKQDVLRAQSDYRFEVKRRWLVNLKTQCLRYQFVGG